MEHGQVETTRIIKYLILLISAVTLARSDAPPNITYTCNAVGVEYANNTLFQHFAIMSGTDGSRKYCKPNTASFFNSCPDGKNQNPLILLYEDSTQKSVIGGKKIYYYKLHCKDGATSVKQISSIFKAAPEILNPSEQTIIATHDFKINLMKGTTKLTDGTPIHIGDVLKLQMTGTEVIIEPISCSAYPNGHAGEKVSLWEFTNNTTCTTKDANIIASNQWSHVATKQSDIEIDLYAFRFANYAEVVIECTAMVCSSTGSSSSTCNKKCVETEPTVTKPSTEAPDVGRKRRDVDIVAKDGSRRIRSSSVSFAVTENEAFSNTSPGLSACCINMIKIVTVGLVLMLTF